MPSKKRKKKELEKKEEEVKKKIKRKKIYVKFILYNLLPILNLKLKKLFKTAEERSIDKL